MRTDAVIEGVAGQLIEAVDRRLHVGGDGPLAQPVAYGLKVVDEPVSLGPGRPGLGLGGHYGRLRGTDAGLLQPDVAVKILEGGHEGIVVGYERIYLARNLGGVAGELFALPANVSRSDHRSGPAQPWPSSPPPTRSAAACR